METDRTTAGQATSTAYTYAFEIKKVYPLRLPTPLLHLRSPKKLSYANPSARHTLRLSLHTDMPELLTWQQHVDETGAGIVTVAPSSTVALRLVFEPLHARRGGGGSALGQPGGQKVEARLWLHNEGTAENEECILFVIDYYAAPQQQLAAG